MSALFGLIGEYIESKIIQSYLWPWTKISTDVKRNRYIGFRHVFVLTFITKPLVSQTIYVFYCLCTDTKWYANSCFVCIRVQPDRQWSCLEPLSVVSIPTSRNYSTVSCRARSFVRRKLTRCSDDWSQARTCETHSHTCSGNVTSFKPFWRIVTVFLQNKLSINIELSYKNISFCNDSYRNVNGKDKSVSINFILLLAKYFIFNCKNKKETPCMFQFEISISERRGLEEIIAFNRNKTDQHIDKWQHLC